MCSDGLCLPGFSPMAFVSYNSPQTWTLVASHRRLEYLHGDFGEEVTAGMLPPSLVHFVTGLEYCDAPPIAAGVLPTSLACLQLGTAFNHPFVVGSLPSSLKVLELSCYNQPLLPGILPASLTHLLLGNEFKPPTQRWCAPSWPHQPACGQ